MKVKRSYTYILFAALTAMALLALVNCGTPAGGKTGDESGSLRQWG